MLLRQSVLAIVASATLFGAAHADMTIQRIPIENAAPVLLLKGDLDPGRELLVVAERAIRDRLIYAQCNPFGTLDFCRSGVTHCHMFALASLNLSIRNLSICGFHFQ